MNHSHSSPGFSLIEITLALMVVSVGMLAVLSLFPAGLDQNARSKGDSHAALFADDVLGGIRAVIMQNPTQAKWDSLTNNTPPDFQTFPVASETAWAPDDLTPKIDNSLHTNTYRNLTPPNYVDHVLRYQISVSNHNANLKGVYLWVWNGEFGKTTNNAGMPVNCCTFYSEYYNPLAYQNSP